MCFPVAFAIASTAISAAGSIMGGMMQQSQANAQAAAYRRQQQLETMQGAYQAGRKQDQINQITGQQIAGTAGSGVSLEGSPSDVIGSTASEGALDVEAIKWGSKVRGDTFGYEATLAKQQGRNAMVGGFVGAAGDLFGGLGKVAGAMDPNKSFLGNLSGGYAH